MIRNLKPDDRDAYQYLKLEAFNYKDIKPFADDIFARAFVWEENGQLIGFCKWTPSIHLSKYAVVESLMVNPAFRSRGIAKALVAAAVEAALKHFDNVKMYDTSRYGQTSKIAKGLGFIEKDAREWWYK